MKTKDIIIWVMTIIIMLFAFILWREIKVVQANDEWKEILQKKWYIELLYEQLSWAQANYEKTSKYCEQKIKDIQAQCKTELDDIATSWTYLRATIEEEENKYFNLVGLVRER